MPPKETSISRKVIFGLIAIAVIVALVYGLRSVLRGKTQVRTAAVTYQDLISTVSTNGKVQPVEAFEAHAPMPTTVEKLYVQAGEQVKAGQLLIHLNDADARARLATAQASLAGAQVTLHDLQAGGTTDERIGLASDLERARQQLAQAQKDLATLQTLQQKGAASSGEVLAAQQRLTAARSSLQVLEQRASPQSRFSAEDRARAQAQFGDASAFVSAARKAYDQANVRAPFAGTVYSLPVQESDFVPGGETLLAIADLNKIQVTAYFDEPEIGKLAIGQPVKIVWDAKPDRVWHGHILQVPTTIINYGTRNVGECLITVDDAHGDLLPNTNVTITVTYMEHHHVLSIPREALHTQGPENYVYRIVNDRLVRTPVQVGGAVNLIRAEIAGGLKENDTVVLNATDNSDLSNGLPVKAIQ